MTKHAVVLAGGKSQLPYILEFQKRGWYVTAIDRDASAIAVQHADQFICNSVYEREKLTDILAPIHEASPITTIFSNSSAAPVAKNVAYLNSVFSTNTGYSPECADLCYDKSDMLHQLRTGGVRLANAIDANTVTPDNLPIIVKPAHNSLGGKGVCKIETEQALDVFLSNEDLTLWVIEEYVEGTEYSVDGVIVNGELEILGISNKVTLDVGHAFIPTQFSLDVNLQDTNPERFSAIYNAADQSAKALSINNSQISLDLKIDSANTVTIIECGLFWDSKIDRLLAYSGLNPYAYYVDRLYEGAEKSLKTAQKSCVMDFIYSDKQTSFNPETLTSQFNQDYLEFERSQGDEVKPPSSVADMVACRFYESGNNHA